MGLWTGIKHAINSTLGTDDFQSLDKIIKSQRTFGVSDTIISIIDSNASTFEYVNKVFCPKTSGAVRIMFDYSGNGILNVYENNILIKTATREPVEISVKKGSRYSFQAGSGSGIQAIKIGAQIVDGSLFEVENR